MLQKTSRTPAITSECETVQKNKDDNISLYYPNVSGLRTKIQSLLRESSALEFDIIVFCETLFNKNHLNSELLDTQLFNIYRNDRCPKNGVVLIATCNRNLDFILVSTDYLSKLFFSDCPLFDKIFHIRL